MPVRDSRGRFVKASEVKERSEWFKELGEEVYEKPIKISRLVRVAIWVSHNRLSILFHLAYVLLCLCMGMLGGFAGAKQGLR